MSSSEKKHKKKVRVLSMDVSVDVILTLNKSIRKRNGNIATSMMRMGIHTVNIKRRRNENEKNIPNKPLTPSVRGLNIFQIYTSTTKLLVSTNPESCG